MPDSVDLVMELLDSEKLVYELHPNPDGSYGVTFRDYNHVLMVWPSKIVAHPSIVDQLVDDVPDLQLSLNNPGSLKDLRRYLRARRPNKHFKDNLE